jgi:hypothetical protein
MRAVPQLLGFDFGAEGDQVGSEIVAGIAQAFIEALQYLLGVQNGMRRVLGDCVCCRDKIVRIGQVLCEKISMRSCQRRCLA